MAQYHFCSLQLTVLYLYYYHSQLFFQQVQFMKVYTGTHSIPIMGVARQAAHACNCTVEDRGYCCTCPVYNDKPRLL